MFSQIMKDPSFLFCALRIPGMRWRGTKAQPHLGPTHARKGEKRGARFLAGGLLGDGLVQPVLSVGEAGDDVADHIVAGGVDHGGRGVNQVADGHQDGEGDLNVLGEEDGADEEYYRIKTYHEDL